MSLNLKDLTLVHDTFHSVILGQSSTPIGQIDLKMCYGIGENKRREMLMFEVASFDIRYNCILGRPFLLKFMAIIQIAYATMKMPGPKGVITIKADQWDALAYENATLHMQGASAKRRRTSKQQRWRRRKVAAPRSDHRHPSHWPSIPLDLLQQRKAHMLPHHPISSPPIIRLMTRRVLMTKKSWLTPATQTRSSGSAQALMLNRNSRSSLVFRTI
jgi:hypothetical protein